MKHRPWYLLLAVGVAGGGPATAGEPVSAVPALKSSAPPASNPALPGVEAVLERWIAARGGQAALQATTNCVATGRAEAAHLGASARCELYARAPRQRLLLFHLPGQGAVAEGFDGETGWQDDPAFGRTEWTGEELAKRRRDATFHRELQFRTLYPDLRVKGLELAEGSRPGRSRRRSPPSAEERFWFSQRTGLLVRHDSTLHLAFGVVERSIEYADYRLVGSVRFPYRWQWRQRAARQAEPEVTVSIRFDNVQFQRAPGRGPLPPSRGGMSRPSLTSRLAFLRYAKRVPRPRLPACGAGAGPGRWGFRRGRPAALKPPHARAGMESSVSAAGVTTPHYQFHSELAQYCFPAASRDSYAKYAYANSIFAAFLAIGILAWPSRGVPGQGAAGDAGVHAGAAPPAGRDTAAA